MWRRFIGIGRRGVALLALAGFLGALPAAAIAGAAEPLTLADWMRTIFVTPDREVDTSQAGVAVTPPPPPPVALQTSSQQIPPEKAPPKNNRLQNQMPDAWLRGQARGRRRRRRPAGIR